MKTLTDYTQKATSNSLEKAGAFFAFGTEQFNEAKKPGVKYFQMGAGLICPQDTATTLKKELDENFKKGIELDIAENGLDAIIDRELRNHEAGYTGDIDDTVRALASYPVTADDVMRVFTANRDKYGD